jgi:hypothetical protein
MSTSIFPKKTSSVAPLAATCLFALNGFLSAAVSMQIAPEQLEFFENKIRPILANHCLECHSGEKGKIKGGLNMDSKEDVLKGGDTGPALEAGNVQGSLIIKAVTWEDDLQMPPKKKLSDEQIADLKKWISIGAPDPREPSKTAAKVDKKAHWAFQPVSKPTPPAVKNASWGTNAIDKFILAKLEEKSMIAAPQADKETLLRRVYYDLTGLPPTPKQIEDFVRDQSPDAYLRVIDQLLNDPGYGERWGRHWLDTARYSDTSGDLTNQADRITEYRYPFAWTYREWVINALNKDLPYDQFIMQQLAADKIPNNPKENLAALGFLTVGQRFGKMTDEVINDRIDVIGRGFLGLTIACARCHDHKFDPVTAADYYALRGIFVSCSEPVGNEMPLIAGDPNSPAFLKFQQELSKLEEKAYGEFYRIQREYSDKMRKHAAVLFEAAMLTRKESTAEENKRGNELIKQAGLDTDATAIVNGAIMSSNRLRSSDDIYGPFVKLASQSANRQKMIRDMLDGKYWSKPNSEVIEFLKAQPSLPSELHEVALLVGKFFAQLEPKVPGLYAAFMDKPKAVSESPEKGAMEAAVFPLRPKAVSEFPEKAAMEAAVFPLRLVPASEISVERLMEEANTSFPNPKMRGILERAADFAGINKFKLTFKGGPVRAMVLKDLETPKNSPLFIRGNPPKPGEQPRVVPRRFIEVLSENGQPTPFKEGSGRLELAQSIARSSNPLTARVIVNRVWMHHFGEGLVRTPDDLGNQAGKPTHPELLDFLANWFVQDLGPQKPAWSLKSLHKAIMLSRAYQQSSNSVFKGGPNDYAKIDPSNSLLWRSNVRRLDFESFRDSLISMAGIMDKSSGGQSFNVTEEPYVFRRSVYAYIDRANMPDLLMQFDMANPTAPNSKRSSTIVPQQALFLMNSSFVAAIVQNIVKRPEIVNAVSVQKDTDKGISAVYRLVLQRLPTPAERKRAIDFLVLENKMQAAIKAEAAQINKDASKLAEKKLQSAQNAKTASAALVNEGELVQRIAFSPWEALVQALLFSNEAAYVN